MIYIDTTIHAGFSFDVAGKAVRDMLTSWITPGAEEDVPKGDKTKKKGGYSSNDIAKGPNSTAIMARTVSKFFQLWFDEWVFIYNLSRLITLSE